MGCRDKRQDSQGVPPQILPTGQLTIQGRRWQSVHPGKCGTNAGRRKSRGTKAGLPKAQLGCYVQNRRDPSSIYRIFIFGISSKGKGWWHDCGATEAHCYTKATTYTTTCAYLAQGINCSHRVMEVVMHQWRIIVIICSSYIYIHMVCFFNDLSHQIYYLKGRDYFDGDRT